MRAESAKTRHFCIVVKAETSTEEVSQIMEIMKSCEKVDKTKTICFHEIINNSLDDYKKENVMSTTDTTITTIENPTDIVGLTLYMPAVLAPSLQHEFAGVIAQRTAALNEVEIDLATWDSSMFEPPHHGRHGPKDAWKLPPLTEADLRAACWAVDSWNDTGRHFAGYLLAVHRIRTFDLADKLDFDGHIPSVFRTLASRLRAIGRAPFWYGDPGTKAHERGQELYVDPDGEPYKLVRRILEERYPEFLPDL